MIAVGSVTVGMPTAEAQKVDRVEGLGFYDLKQFPFEYHLKTLDKLREGEVIRYLPSQSLSGRCLDSRPGRVCAGNKGGGFAFETTDDIELGMKYYFTQRVDNDIAEVDSAFPLVNDQGAYSNFIILRREGQKVVDVVPVTYNIGPPLLEIPMMTP